MKQTAGDPMALKSTGSVKYDGFRVDIVPCQLDDGTEFIPDLWCMEHPAVAEFVKKYPNYWKRSELFYGWVGERYNILAVYYIRSEKAP